MPRPDLRAGAQIPFFTDESGLYETPVGFFPSSVPQFRSLTGVTLDSLYIFNEASSDLVDRAGSTNITVAGTPTFSVQREGRQGIHYDENTDAHRADVHAVGSTSFIGFGIFGIQTGASDFAGLMGRTNLTGAEEWIVYHRTSGIITARVRDDGAGSLEFSTASAAALTTQLHFVGLQVDRAASVTRLRVSAPGRAVLAAEGSISSFSSLNGASQLYGFGPAIGSTPFRGAFVCYGGIRINADAAGAAVLQRVAAGLGFE